MILNHCYGEDTMRHPILTAALAGTVALTMVGCSTNKGDQSASGDKSDKPVIVASTNVWGSVAQAVGGDQAEVKSVITKPTQDPHDYEATAQDKLAFSKASIAIVNGGGYDDWATTLAKSSDSKPTLIDAVTASGLKKPMTPTMTRTPSTRSTAATTRITRATITTTASSTNTSSTASTPHSRCPR